MEEIKVPIVNISVAVKMQGPRAGRLSIFIETYSPNIVNPAFGESSEEYQVMTLRDIQKSLRTIGAGCRNVSIIGREPLMTPNIKPLLVMLDSLSYTTEVHTYGNVHLDDYRPSSTSVRSAILSGIKRASRVNFLLHYSAGSNLYESELKYLQPADAFLCRIRSEEDLDECIDLVKRYNIQDVYFGLSKDMIAPEKIVSRLITEKLWRIKFQPVLYNPKEF